MPTQIFRHQATAVLRAPLFPLGTAGDPFDPEGQFRLGLLAAAPEFLRQLDEAHARGTIGPKLRRTLLKYQLRASGRCTPFGTFAGLCTLRAVPDADSGLVIAAPKDHLLRVQADAVWRASFDAQHPATAETRYRTNQSLYRAGPAFRFAAARNESGTTHYDLSSVPAELVLDAVLELAAAGATCAQLEGCVAEMAGVDAEEAAQFLSELRAAQVLVPESGALLTGSDRLSLAIDMPAQPPSPGLDLQTSGRMQQLTPAGFARLHHRLNALTPGRPPFEPTLQLDMYLKCRGGISASRLDQLAQELSDLAPLATPYRLPLLDAFKMQFAERYELRAVPLLEALDPDLGIGYGAADPCQWTGSLLSDLPLAAIQDPSPAGNAALERFIRRKLTGAFRSGASEIVISKDELAGLQPEPAPRFPKTQSLMGTLTQSGDGDSWQFCLSYAGGASAVSLLGRFCQGSEEIAALVDDLVRLEAEAEPECILAEIVHLPAATLGNVSRRPVLRKYEIPYLGRSGALPEDQIPVDDLYLQLQGHELCLFSRRLGKRVLPRLGTAHNFTTHALPLYRLLCELQFQECSLPVSWDWGVFRDEPVLPAVRYGHIQLCRRSWGFDPAVIAAMPLDAFLTLLTGMQLPQHVCCGLGDQQLLLHPGDPEHAALLYRELRAQPGLRIFEASMEAGAAFVRNAAGEGFTNELIVPLVNTLHRPSPGLKMPLPGPGAARSIAPGQGSWHYLKLYCGYSLGDALLRGGLSGLCADLLAAGIISHWFFLRYEDPEPHLRLRFCLTAPLARPGLEAGLQPWLGAAFGSGMLHRIVVDTYHRELERYGPTTIEAVEKLFAADSACTLAFINSTEDAPDEEERFAFACRSIDLLLEDAGLGLLERADLMSPLAAAFFNEHGGGIPLQQSLNDAYRQRRASLEPLLRGAGCNAAQSFLEARSLQNRPLFGTLSPDAVLSMLPDLVHMLVNRIFIAAQRRYELLIYHCLAKQYRSAATRIIPATASGRLRE